MWAWGEPLLAVVKEYLLSNMWEVKLYGDPYPTQLQSQCSAGDPRDATMAKGRQSHKFSEFSHSSHTGRVAVSYIMMVCGVIHLKLAPPRHLAWSIMQFEYLNHPLL